MGKRENIFLGDARMETDFPEVQGEMVDIDGLPFYCISNYQAMPPFFMSLTGPDDHWMFIASNGGVTAGRRDPRHSLFPYTTDDKIIDSASTTGPKTIFKVHTQQGSSLWEPFTGQILSAWKIERKLYKCIYGNILRFEEINHSLHLRFSYTWQFSTGYGFVRTSELKNLSSATIKLSLLDGLRNILPYGVDEGMQLSYSTLVDAYKRSQLDADSGIGIYFLSSIPTDRAEPSEGLKATTVWSLGLEDTTYLLSEDQIERFRCARTVGQEEDMCARRGAYFVNSELSLKGKELKKWLIVAELEQDRAGVVALEEKIKGGNDFVREIQNDMAVGTEELVRLVAKADGLQACSDELESARHFSNVLYNIMRGGLFPNDYLIDRDDFLSFLNEFNIPLSQALGKFLLKSLSPTIGREELISLAKKTDNADFLRLATEYLPLTYSRRHGDPSRPWNRFLINNKNPDGSARFDYQGNWRDIFQNWEALSSSFPGYLDGMICRFLNASTADGYNPYRIMRSGIDWEVVDPDDPWSNIGYWGDHQVVYLLKLLETSERFHPGRLEKWFSHEIFVYANLPYRIREYRARLEDPRNTIEYDDDLAETIYARVKKTGADGKLIFTEDGSCKVNLVEKLMVPVIAKLSNFVVDGGIWLNTQRPEWNDANNALVGNGLSMVTVYYLRRHLVFIRNLLHSSAMRTFGISVPVYLWMTEVSRIFNRHSHILPGPFDSGQRKRLVDELGLSMDAYLKSVYDTGFSGEKTDLKKEQLLDFLDISLKYLEASMDNSKRDDGLYHAYNLMQREGEDGIQVVHLQQMLEGQVAVLSSGYLGTGASLDLLEALRKSSLYREDQHSYILYPDKTLTGFMEKNKIAGQQLESVSCVQAFLKIDDFRIIGPDGEGGYLFNGKLKNAADLDKLLDDVEKDYPGELSEPCRKELVSLFESHFGHASFTGRSGTFYKYEGLGSIYWHMVSKLVLAIQEVCLTACREEDADPDVVQTLAAHYHETKSGLGLHKSPDAYGAFPTDPYSHTPKHAGVQQPGMTGQVKEDILSRWGELGVEIQKGCLSFSPQLLPKDAFFSESAVFVYRSADGTRKELTLPEGTLAFTYCQVPIVYHLAEEQKTEIRKADNTMELAGNQLSAAQSAMLFKRTGEVERVDVYLRLGD